ncbi:MAG: alpha/beta fold hydrolase, partial [Symploca sp. SIO2G7]|nr:alpha/beta fold hydrolase [Symploca sp. SIO2G7]
VQGYRIELGEIETTLEQLADVKQAIVMLKGEAQATKRLVAYVVSANVALTNAEPKSTSESLKRQLQRLLPDYMVPSTFVFLANLPLTANGKVDRKGLPEPQSLSDLSSPSSESTTSVDAALIEQITQLIAGVLNVDTIAPHANLLDMGANSIDMARIANLMEQQLQHRLQIRDLYNLASIKAIAKFIAGTDDIPVAATATTTAHKWIVCSHPRPNPKLRLLCFSHAGGAARVFHNWAELLPPTVEICAIELPGRGRRLSETPFTNIDLLLQALGPELLPILDIPFACFGHSLGAWIAFELCRWLQQNVQLTPRHLWIAAARAPHLPSEISPIYDLPDSNFIVELRRCGGTSEEVLNNPELMTLMIPTLKADFSLLETYRYQPGAQLTCPITCFWGKQDARVNKADIAAWRQHTDTFTLEAIPGDHFFVHNPLFPKSLLSELMGFDCVESFNQKAQ